MPVMIIKALGIGKSNEDICFSDASEIEAWAKGYIAKSCEIGITSGYIDNTYRSKNPITRAEVAFYISKAFIDLKIK